MRAETSKSSAPVTRPVAPEVDRDTGEHMPRKRAVDLISGAGGRARPAVAVALLAAADNPTPCTTAIPASQHARPVAVDGVAVAGDLREQVHVDRRGQKTTRRRRRGASAAFRTPRHRPDGSASSALPVRPRIANRSSSVAITAPAVAGDRDRDRHDATHLCVDGELKPLR